MSSARLEVLVRMDGRLEFIYDDRLAPLLTIGAAAVTRASHVEPVSGGGWVADLAPVTGPRLGPFPLRAQALAAEGTWLRANLLGVPAPGC